MAQSTARTRAAHSTNAQLSFLDQLAPMPATDGDQYTLLPDLMRGYPLTASSASRYEVELAIDLRPTRTAA